MVDSTKVHVGIYMYMHVYMYMYIFTHVHVHVCTVECPCVSMVAPDLGALASLLDSLSSKENLIRKVNEGGGGGAWR